MSLAGYAEIFWRNVQASGVVPQISLIMGPCAGGAVYSPAITDFILMTEGSSYMFITGPDVVKTVTGEDVSFEDLGGASAHATRSGVAHLVAPDEQACIEDARYLLTFLPQNNLESAPYAPPTDPVDRESPELDSLIPDSPNKPYDIKRVDRDRSIDDGAFLESFTVVRGEHRLRVRPARRACGRRRRQPARGARGRAGHRRFGQGRPIRPHVRRLQRPAA